MKLGNIIHLESHLPVVFHDGRAFALADRGIDLQELLSRPDELRQAADLAVSKGLAMNVAPEQILAPVLKPRKILGIGLNYADHAAETGREPPKNQTWFVKQVTALNAPYGQIMMPAVSECLDYETELVVVIGRKGRHVPAERAHEIIAGYTCGNDVSVRDWQRATPTMNMGKGFDSHAPIGPWIVTPDEIGDVNELGLRTYVNGELRQNGNTSELIHKIPELIAHLTAAFTLEPGDLLFTGTPAGVGVAHAPPKYLKPGDRVRIEIDRIGHIEHDIIQERAETRIG